MTLIPALESQREADLWVQRYSGLQSKFEDSQDCTEKENNKQTNQHQNQKTFSKAYTLDPSVEKKYLTFTVKVFSLK